MEVGFSWQTISVRKLRFTFFFFLTASPVGFMTITCSETFCMTLFDYFQAPKIAFFHL